MNKEYSKGYKRGYETAWATVIKFLSDNILPSEAIITHLKEYYDSYPCVTPIDEVIDDFNSRS